MSDGCTMEEKEKKKKTRKKDTFYPGLNFGMKKNVVQEYGKPEEISRFVKLLKESNSLKHKMWAEGYSGETFRGYRLQVQEISAELRGLRKLFRTRHTDSFDNGLYRCSVLVHPYQLSVPVGKVGHINGWYRRTIQHGLPKGSLLMWSCRDEIGNCEFIVSDTGYVIKVPRGHSSSDHIVPVDQLGSVEE